MTGNNETRRYYNRCEYKPTSKVSIDRVMNDCAPVAIGNLRDIIIYITKEGQSTITTGPVSPPPYRLGSPRTV